VTRSPWDRRIERAEELARSVPEAAQLLRFYVEVATFQRSVEQAALPALPLDSPDLDRILRPHLDRLLILMKRIAPPQVSQEVPFLQHLLLQPYAECQARRGGISRASVQPLCPFCGEKPVVAALRPAGDGGKRSLICSLCSTEWDFRRLLCPRCGEEDREKLPIYTAEQFPHVRVEACDSCHGYLKAVDLTSNGLAVPEVDELASLALDLWADEKGYTKLQTNLFGL
jgi:FdhE protein